ncbi:MULTISPECIES: hypothetical protein [Bradyrhizobium]|uniref:hypothetical protein n=1 Tax=Bradyrhizobium TaxID=374 RepID=UPI001FCD7459|nr:MULTISPECIES: hypothetical protein [Bradyrhizobium]
MTDLDFRVGRANAVFFSAASAENNTAIANIPVSTGIMNFNFICLPCRLRPVAGTVMTGCASVN